MSHSPEKTIQDLLNILSFFVFKLGKLILKHPPPHTHTLSLEETSAFRLLSLCIQVTKEYIILLYLDDQPTYTTYFGHINPSCIHCGTSPHGEFENELLNTEAIKAPCLPNMWKALLCLPIRFSEVTVCGVCPLLMIMGLLITATGVVPLGIVGPTSFSAGGYQYMAKPQSFTNNVLVGEVH